MRVPIIYMVGRSVCSHRPHDYPEVLMPRHRKDPLAPLLRFPRFVGADRHMSQKQVWNEVVFPRLEAAFAALEDRVEVMVRDVVAREVARRDSMAQHPSNGVA